jgi:hypothetical protein
MRMMFDINPSYEVFIQEQETGNMITQTEDINISNNYFLWIRDPDSNYKNRKGTLEKQSLEI